MKSNLPTVGGIQLATAVIACGLAAILLASGSPHAAVACAIGAAIIIANFYLLAWVGQWIFAIAGQTGGAHRLGLVAAPLKLLFIVSVVALLLSRTKLDVPGFVLGVLAQPAAIFIETWRSRHSGRRMHAGAEAIIESD
jgi:hypothetical protein